MHICQANPELQCRENVRQRARVLCVEEVNKKDVENPPNSGEENQVFGNPSVGQKTK